MDNKSKSVNNFSVASLGVDSLILNDLINLGFSCSSYYDLMDNKSEDIVICTNEIVRLHELDKLKAAFPKSEIFFLDTKMHISSFNHASLVCEQNGIELLHPRSTGKSIGNRLLELIGVEIEGKKNLIGFFGTSSGIGVTSIAGEFSRSMAKSGLKVLMLGLNLLDPGWNEKPKASLDQWRTKLSGRVLRESDFNDCVEYDGFSYLPGNYDYIGAQEYSEEEIERLLEVAHNIYDVVVGDFGSYPDSAAWAVGINSSNIKYLVSKPNDRYKAERILNVASHFSVQPSDFYLICNRSNSFSDSGITPKLLATELKVPMLMEIPVITDQMKQLSISLSRSDQRRLDDHIQILMKNMKGGK